MEPLNQFRNWLKDIRERPDLRLPYRRNGGKGPGPFSPEARKMILTELLQTEKQVGLELISDGEIGLIKS